MAEDFKNIIKLNQLARFKELADGKYVNKEDALVKTSIDDDLVILKEDKLTINVTTTDNTIYKIGDYYISGGEAVPPIKIFDNDDDTERQGKLWLYEDGTMVLENVEKFKQIEVYYSLKGTSQIQYYKIMTEMIDAPKENNGVFTIFNPSENILVYTFEQVEVSYKSSEEGSTTTIKSLAGEESLVKIERIYGILEV